MSTLGWVLVWVAGGWALWALTLGFADAMLRREHRDALAMRDWKETVEAMRRMADREGNA
jgi:hypothetical protein